MQTIKPCLWFDNQAEDAAKFYVSLFKNSKITDTSYYSGDEGMAPAGSVMLVEFELDGMHFQGLNGGPVFEFSPAVSMSVSVDTQEELDRLWDALSSDPESEQCGWCKDKFGLSWQIVPSVMAKLFSDPDPQRVARAMAAMMQMKKLDIAALEAAANG